MTTLPALHAYLPLLPRAFAIASSCQDRCIRLRISISHWQEQESSDYAKADFVTADDGGLVKNLQGSFPFIVPLAVAPIATLHSPIR